jgi:hypothetical protein
MQVTHAGIWKSPRASITSACKEANMTRPSVIGTRGATQVRVYPDTFNLGQTDCARIRLRIAREGLERSSARLLSTEYEPPITLPMWSRMHRADRADYDRAMTVLEGRA